MKEEGAGVAGKRTRGTAAQDTGIRLIVSNESEAEVDDVIGALREGREFVYWGIDKAVKADYLFVHRRGVKDVCGVLKVWGRRPVDRELITEDDFVRHRPAGWRTRLQDRAKFYRVCAAMRVHFPFEELRNRHGTPLTEQGMHDMVFVDCQRFVKF